MELPAFLSTRLGTCVQPSPLSQNPPNPPQEVYESWPKTYDTPGLDVPMPWTESCPQGQDPDEHHEL
jgi:hypothetical protein